MQYQMKKSYLLLGIIFLLTTIELSTALGLTLHSGDTLFVSHGTTPVVDGYISSGEWDDAISVVLVEPGGSQGDAIVYLKHDSNNLFAAFENSNSNYWVWWILIDTQNNGGTAPRVDDYKLVGPGFNVEYVGNGSGWVETTPTGWSNMGNEYTSECYISYNKLGITPGVPKTIGLAICYGGGMPWENVWPPGFDTWNDEVIPNTWGDIVSNNNWGQGPAVKELNVGVKADVDFQSYPNPFSKVLRIDFTLSNPNHTVLQIYDIEGRLIRTLVNGQLNAGHHELRWNRRNHDGKIVPAGTYFCQLRTGKVIHTQSIVVVN
jgi:hypothetical protein